MARPSATPYMRRMTDRPTLLVAQPHLAAVAALLAGHYAVLLLWDDPTDAQLADVRAIIVAGEFAVDRALVDRMPKLGLIACFTVGYDGIDVAWATTRGLLVSHAQDANDEDVADHAIGLIVGHRRAIVSGDRMLRAGEWHARAKTLTRSLGGARLGIVGLGGIGCAVARRGAAMRMDVAWWGPTPKPDAAWPRADGLVDLARDSDILVVAARAHAGNVGLISAEVIAALGQDGLLVNVARGQLVDEDAAIAALKDGTLGGAALDVFASEPTAASRWADVPNTVLTPHTAGATQEAVQKMAGMLVANLKAFFAGEALPNPAV
jgi:lactate dehydrogenase-like 2-hydroxyacid dehydrogenase